MLMLYNISMEKNSNNEGRYSRQEAFAGIGREGQERIGNGRVLLIGCGALGTNIAAAIVRAGVKSLHIVDPDRVELSNLQRQALFDENDAEQAGYKAETAIGKLTKVNSSVDYSFTIGKFGSDTADGFVSSDYDIILDATDDITARFDINEYAVGNSLPWVFGAVAGSAGMAAFFPAGGKPCLNCIFDRPASRTDVDTAQTKGVIQPVVTMTTSLQTAWALKYLATGEMGPKMAHYDIWADRFAISELESSSKGCGCCGDN